MENFGNFTKNIYIWVGLVLGKIWKCWKLHREIFGSHLTIFTSPLALTSTHAHSDQGKRSVGKYFFSYKYLHKVYSSQQSSQISHSNRRRKLWKVLQQNYGGFNQLYKKIFIQETFLNIEDQKMPGIIRKFL